MDSMIKTLMDLPMFRGTSYERMSELVGEFKFHFLKYQPGNDIVLAGQECTNLVFILSGSVRAVTSNENGRFKVLQTLSAPSIITPDFLFGRLTHYPCTVTAIEPTNILQISKSEYLQILAKDTVFMLNYLNYISTNAQKSVNGFMSLTSGSIEERLGLWVACLTQSDATDVEIQCRLRDLYTMFGVPRSSFILALDNLRAKQVIDYSASEIRILSRPDLINPVIKVHMAPQA